MVKIAYGESNFKSLIEDGCYYQDRMNTPKFNTRTNLKSFCVGVVGDKLTWKEV